MISAFFDPSFTIFCEIMLNSQYHLICKTDYVILAHDQPTEWKLWHLLKDQQAAQEEVQEYTVDCRWLECLSSGIKILKMKLWNVKLCNFS
jgi:hypothetical protein